MKFNSCLLFCILAFLLASCDDDPKKPSASADQMTTVIVDMMQTTTPDQKMIEPDQEIKEIKDMDVVVGDQAVADAQIIDMNTINFTACADGVDNDTDGLIDLFDIDCVNNQDPTEDQTTSSAKCLNGLDDDTDGLIDFPYDIGCSGAGDGDESDPISAPLCTNGQDDDSDGKTDFPNDPGCSGIGDLDETDSPILPLCANGQDDDGDGLIDFPADGTCVSAGAWSEAVSCAQRDVFDLNTLTSENGYYDGDLSTLGNSQIQGTCGGSAGPEQIFVWRATRPFKKVTFNTIYEQTSKPVVVYVRSACTSTTDLACDRGPSEIITGTSVTVSNIDAGLFYVFVDTSSQTAGPGTFRISVETTEAEACRDTVDNDQDGVIDLLDPGCESEFDIDETNPATLPQCGDQLDNDNDGATDYPSDSDCSAAGGSKEGPLCAITYNNNFTVPAGGGLVTVPFNPNFNTSETNGCRDNTGPESVAVITLDEASTIQVSFTDTTAPFSAYLRAICDSTTQIACVPNANTALSTDILSAGTYFLYIDYNTEQAIPANNPEIQVIITSQVTACNDQQDNDEDQLIDLFDPGCTSNRDDSEVNGQDLPACADGIDNDNDGAIDYPADSNCTGAGGAYEASLCNDFTAIYVSGQGGAFGFEPIDGQNGTDATCSYGTGDEAVFAVQINELSEIILNVTENDGSIADVYRSLRTTCDDLDSELYCLSSFDNATSFTNLEAGIYYLFVERSEFSTPDPFNVSITIRSLITSCNDEVDNDADDKIDRADPGCSNDFDEDETDPAELPACADGIDNDDDLLIDYPQDIQCNRASQTQETASCAQATIEQSFYQDPNNTDIEMRFSTIVSTLGGTNQYTASCGLNASSPEKVLALNLTSRSNVVIETSGASGSFDTVLHARKTFCDDSSAEIRCDDDGADAPRMSKLSLNALEAGNYFIFVDGFGDSNSGTVTVNITTTRLVIPITQCNDEIDNDGDQLIDLMDSGCINGQSTSENDPAVTPICADGLDNDNDGNTDYPQDLECTGAGGLYEGSLCTGFDAVFVNGIGGTYRFEPVDNQSASEPTCVSSFSDTGDEAVFAVQLTELSHIIINVTNDDGSPTYVYRSLRTVCDDATTEEYCLDSFDEADRFEGLNAGIYYLFVERADYNAPNPFNVEITIDSVVKACNDGVDNDGDNRIDQFDVGCATSTDDDETDGQSLPECADGLDNDMDGDVDFPDDLECTRAGQPQEQPFCNLAPVAETLIQESRIITLNTSNQMNNYTSSGCGSSARSPEQVFAVILHEPSNIVATVTNATNGYDTVMFVRKDNCDLASAELSCDDDGAGLPLSMITLNRMDPGIYYFFIDGYSSNNSGEATIDVQVTPLSDF